MQKKIEERNQIVSAMCERCDADVGEAFRQGVIGPRQYREFLVRCTTCQELDECKRLLGEKGETLPEAPDYCRNKIEIAEMRGRLKKALG